MSITIVVIDEQALFRSAVIQVLSSDLEFTVIGECSSGPNCLSLIKSLKPDIVIIETNNKSKIGLQYLKDIYKLENKPRCIVLTFSTSFDDLLEALRAGADGYILKNVEPDELCKKIKQVNCGVTVIDESLKNAIIYETISTYGEALLTEREKDVLECLESGLNNKKIAIFLGVCETTVKKHIQNLFTKLKLSSRLQVAVWAYKNKLSIEKE